MPPRNALPSFVRLPAEVNVASNSPAVLPLGILADVEGGSGWSISGMDVKEVPAEDEPGYNFVRTAIIQGRLEEATEDEFNAVQEAHAEVSRLHPVAFAPGETPPPWNEPALITTSARLRKRLIQGRLSGEFPTTTTEEDYGDLSHDELKSRAQARGLATSGTKADLQQRLEEHDRTTADVRSQNAPGRGVRGQNSA